MNRAIKIVLFLLLFIWCIGFAAEFILPVFDKVIYLLPFLKKNYSLLCHQDHLKLISCGSYETLVCARCAGIYIGALFASFINLFLRKSPSIGRNLLFFSSIPMLSDVLATTLKFYNYSKIAAFLTGILFGIISFSYFYSALLELLIEIRDKKK